MGWSCLGPLPLMEMELFPRRWPRRQEDSLEAGEGEVAGLGTRWGTSAVEGSCLVINWSKCGRRGD
jgi:hypothetical protein